MEERTAQEEGSEELLEQWIDSAYSFKIPKQGEILKGTVVSVSPSEILIDIGSKSEGIVPSREVEKMGPELLSQVKEGDEVWAYVVRPESMQGGAILSLLRAKLERDWERAAQLYESQETFEGVVSSYNKGGVIVQLGQVRGFVPASQLDSSRRIEKREEYLAGLVGQKLKLKVIEVDRGRNRLIFSEQAAMQEWRKEQKERLLAELKEGDICRGVVTGLRDFGAFVDLGGADGLIHVSELSWGRVKHPSEVLEIGQEVEVYVLRVDKERKRIGLSLKRLHDPWSEVDQKYSVGQIVQGKITNLTNFGAFAEIEEGVEGLIHISELSDKRINHPREVVQEGTIVPLLILNIDSAKRRLSLSLRQALAMTEGTAKGEEVEAGPSGEAEEEIQPEKVEAGVEET